MTEEQNNKANHPLAPDSEKVDKIGEHGQGEAYSFEEDDFVKGSEAEQPAPMFNIPSIVLALIASFVAIHLLLDSMALQTKNLMTLLGAFIPARFSSDIALFSGDSSLAVLYSWVSYSFLHGNFEHIFFNSIWLVIFGSAVARRISTTAFLLFFALTSFGGALAHLVMHWNGGMPMIGASAVVSGLTGAAVRFMFNRESLTEEEASSGDWASHTRLLSVLETLQNRNALFLIVIWTVFNYLVGSGMIPLAGEGVNIAWEAHLGGFFTGFLFYQFFDQKRK